MKTYRRSMAGWWQKNPYYVWYMVREASSVFLTAYALLLLLGVYRLGQGPAAFDAWRNALGQPGSLVFHAVALALVIYHSWTWFKIMPRTMPAPRLGEARIPDAAIVSGGVIAVIACTVAIVGLAWS